MGVAEKMALDLNAARHRLFGSLCFWGDWFGKPHDNVHKIAQCDAREDILQLTFNQGELLQVWKPLRLSIHGHAFVIGDAARVRWDWFLYGGLAISRNRRYCDYRRVENGIVGDTDFMPQAGGFRADGTHSAVEMT
jgi:hypothetical protein